MFSRLSFLTSILYLLIGISSAITDVIPYLKFCDHVTTYGVKCETHKVVTEDGYILAIQRIGNGQPVNKSLLPVLVMHGAACSSDTLIIMGNVSTPVEMALAGYDVWMGNSRGNTYSRNHTTLDPDTDKQFWDFSFHEMANYDLPATIDLILKETEQKKLYAMGHSQGTTIFFALGSLRPEYNKKIQMLIAMAPVAYLPLELFDIVSLDLLKAVGFNELVSRDSIENRLLQFLCSQGQLGYQLCLAGISQLGGPYSDNEMTQEIFEELIKYYLSGVSVKTGQHFEQVAASERFAYFDYGAIRNLFRYMKIQAPKYDLTKVTMPVAMVPGGNDKVATPENVARLRSELPNVVSFNEIPLYNHYSFIATASMPTVLNALVFELLKKEL